MYFYFIMYLIVNLQLRLHNFDLLDSYFVRTCVVVLLKILKNSCI
jgi:hypothetical protein